MHKKPINNKPARAMSSREFAQHVSEVAKGKWAAGIYSFDGNTEYLMPNAHAGQEFILSGVTYSWAIQPGHKLRGGSGRSHPRLIVKANGTLLGEFAIANEYGSEKKAVSAALNAMLKHQRSLPSQRDSAEDSKAIFAGAKNNEGSKQKAEDDPFKPGVKCEIVNVHIPAWRDQIGKHVVVIKALDTSIIAHDDKPVRYRINRKGNKVIEYDPRCIGTFYSRSQLRVLPPATLNKVNHRTPALDKSETVTNNCPVCLMGRAVEIDDTHNPNRVIISSKPVFAYQCDTCGWETAGHVVDDDYKEILAERWNENSRTLIASARYRLGISMIENRFSAWGKYFAYQMVV
jgi:hypothetical protein